MIEKIIFKYVLFPMVVVAASYEDIKTHKVYIPLVLSLIPIACVFQFAASGFVVASITIPILCLSRFFNIQKGDILAYFASSFFLTDYQIMPFFALNIALALATWAFTKYIQKQDRFPLIPSILFSCLIISLTPDIIQYMSNISINQNQITNVTDAVQAPGLSLLVPSLPIKNFGNGLAELISIMHPIMSTKDGIGLAAPQIAYNVQVILLHRDIQRYGADALADALTEHGYVLINPKIVSRSEEKVDLYKGEGCLSLEKAMPGKVERHKSIVIEYQDVKGNVHKAELSMQIATIVQHEMDHLFGILYPARMKESDSKTLWAKYVKDLGLGVNQIVSFTKIMQKNLAHTERNIGKNNVFGVEEMKSFAQNIGIANEQIDELIKRAVHCGA